MLNKDYINNVLATTENKKIVVASKYYQNDEIRLLYECGIKDFGENKAQSFLEKYQILKDLDINWHFIGHLQTNKVAAIINKIDVLESLDSYHLASYIERYRIGVLNCFLQIKLVDNKFGLKEDEILSFLESIKQFKSIKITGLMTILDVNLSDEEKLNLFKKLVSIKNHLNELGYKDIKEISAGMSNDYKLAIKAGATNLRLGRIFMGGN